MILLHTVKSSVNDWYQKLFGQIQWFRPKMMVFGISEIIKKSKFFRFQKFSNFPRKLLHPEITVSQKSISSQFSPPRYNFGDWRSLSHVLRVVSPVHFYLSFSHVIYHFVLTNGNTESVIDFMIPIIFHISPYWGHEDVLWVLYGGSSTYRRCS